MWSGDGQIETPFFRHYWQSVRMRTGLDLCSRNTELGRFYSHFHSPSLFQPFLHPFWFVNGFQPRASSLWIQCDQRNWQQNILGVKVLYPTLFPGGRSVTKILFTQSESACSMPVSASGPLCLHSCPLGLFAQSPHTAVLWASLHSCPTQLSSGPLSSTLPQLQPLHCSPAALQPCHRVMPRALGGALFIESTVMYCPRVCSELVNQGQVRILATGTLILSTPA